jgi:hypothetical protein
MQKNLEEETKSTVKLRQIALLHLHTYIYTVYTDAKKQKELVPMTKRRGGRGYMSGLIFEVLASKK